MEKQEFYFSTDIETDGPIPGRNSMLSLGSVLFSAQGEVLDKFYANLLPKYGCIQDPETMRWWETQPEAWLAAITDAEQPDKVMARYCAWVKEWKKALKADIVFVAYPVTFDFMFVYWYLIYYCQESPFSFSALDIKTYAMAKLGHTYKKSTKKYMPKEWFKELPAHTHNALNDAMEQGVLFCNMLKYQLPRN